MPILGRPSRPRHCGRPPVVASGRSVVAFWRLRDRSAGHRPRHDTQAWRRGGARDGLPDVLATYHPSFLLRVKSRPEGEETYAQFIADLKLARAYLPDESDS